MSGATQGRAGSRWATRSDEARPRAAERDRVDAQARAQLAADEARFTGAVGARDSAGSGGTTPRRTSVSLGEAWSSFLRHPSPWMIGGTLLVALVARVAVGDWRWTDTLVPVLMVATFPVVEWLIHVCILHWRPRRLGPVELDSLLARKHRAHHADPRDIPLVFIPWQVLCWLLPAYVVVAVLVVPRLALGLTFLVSVTALGFVYEWTHYLVHSDYRPRSRAYRVVWRNHRLHHYKNEHYWFTVTTAGTADRLLGTHPEPSAVETSPTVRDLHAREGAV